MSIFLQDVHAKVNQFRRIFTQTVTQQYNSSPLARRMSWTDRSVQ